MRTKRALALPAILALLFVAGCAEDAGARANTGDGGPETGDRDITAENATPARPTGDGARAAAGVADDAVADALEAAEKAASRAGAGERDAADPERRSGGASGGEKVVLKIRGDDGARFVGACSVGGEDRKVGGRVPARYVFEPDGERLACEVRENGPETLRVVLDTGDNVRSVSQSGPGKSKVNLTLSEDGVSVTQSSSGSSSQAVQSGTSSQVQSSVVETR